MVKLIKSDQGRNLESGHNFLPNADQQLSVQIFKNERFLERYYERAAGFFGAFGDETWGSFENDFDQESL